MGQQYRLPNKGRYRDRKDLLPVYIAVFGTLISWESPNLFFPEDALAGAIIRGLLDLFFGTVKADYLGMFHSPLLKTEALRTQLCT
jgi:hypothetical protein